MRWLIVLLTTSFFVGCGLLFVGCGDATADTEDEQNPEEEQSDSDVSLEGDDLEPETNDESGDVESAIVPLSDNQVLVQKTLTCDSTTYNYVQYKTTGGEGQAACQGTPGELCLCEVTSVDSEKVTTSVSSTFSGNRKICQDAYDGVKAQNTGCSEVVSEGADRYIY